MSNLENAKIYRRVGNSGTDQYAVVNLDATNFCVTLNSQVYTIGNRFENINDWAVWKRDAEGHVTVAAPYNDTDAANKGYVESNYSKLGHNHDSAYAALGHTHTTSLSSSTATPSITLSYSGKYALTAGGTTYTFQMPAPGMTTVTSSGSGQLVNSISYNSDSHALSYSLIGGSANPVTSPIYIGHADLSFINTVGRGGFRSTSPTATTAGYPHNGQFNWSNFGGVTNSWGFQITALDIPHDRYNQLRVWQNGLVYNKYLNSSGSTVDIFTIDPDGNTNVTGTLAVAGAITSGGTTVSLVGHTHSISAITDVSTIGTTAVSTKTISNNSASIASGNSDLVTGGAIYNYVENEGGKVKSVKVNGTTYNPEAGVITLPNYPVIPTNVSVFTNDAGYLTQHQAIPSIKSATLSWGVAVEYGNNVSGTSVKLTMPAKPSYTAGDVGALPSTTAFLAAISKSSNTYTITKSDSTTVSWTIPTIPSNVSAFTNDAGYLTTVAWGDVTNKPTTFAPSAHSHPLNEITGVSTIGTTAVSTKTISTSSASIASGNADLVTGGAIYSYVENEGGKVKSVKVNGTVYTPVSGVITLPTYPTVPSNVSAFTNDAGYITQHQAIPVIDSVTLSWGSAATYGQNAAGNNVTITLPAKPANTASLSWDADNHAVKAGVDNTSAVIPLGSTIGIGLLSIGTAAGQAAAGNHTHSAYVNQNAYGNIKVGSTTTAAGSTTDTITFAASGDLSVSISSKTITYSVTLPTTLPASDVYAWAKAANKPSYTAGEVGALPSTTTYLASISNSGNTYTITSSAGNKTSWTLPTVPTKVSAFTNDAGYLTTVAWDDVTNKPTTFTPSAHTHPLSDITGISTIGTAAVSTITVSTSSASIASGNAALVTGGAIYNYVQNEGGKVKSLTVGSTNYTPTNGVITIPAYPSVSNSTITVKQTGISDQTFTLNGGAVTISLADTNTWRPLGTGATDAAAGDHTHTVFNGLRINTGVNTTPLKISRGAYDAESVSYGVEDGAHKIQYTNDEANSGIVWTLINTDTESGGGASASTHTMSLTSSNTGMALHIDGTAVSLNGHTHSQYLTSQSNDFGKIKVGATTTTAGSIQDVITFAAGGDLGVSISGKTITYSVTLPTQLPASDVAAWAKAANKPTYTWTEINNKPTTFTPSTHTHPLTDITGVSTIGTTAASTISITTTVNSSSTDSQIPTAKAVWNVANSAGKVKEIQINGATQTISAAGVVNLPAYPVIPSTYAWTSITGKPTLSISGNTITIGDNSTTWTNTTYASGSGISIGTGNKINHSNSVTAQTTQALYPIKIDAQGHISAYGSAVTSLPASDVYSWAKAENKPTYTASEVGALPSTTSFLASAGKSGNTYTITNSAGGTVTWTIPVVPSTYAWTSITGKPTLSVSGNTITIGDNSTTWTDTTYTNGSGISIGTGNKINHSNSVTAQTTQAVYPIKIDAQGHISAYGSAVTIPVVNNATLTIQKNGTTIKSFTANASTDVTCNIAVPTTINDLTGWATIGTTAASTTAITTTIGSSTTSTKIPTEGAIRAALNGFAPTGNYVTKEMFSYNTSTGVLTIDLG